jgi:ABC-type lipoprotein export system ATPase subunit
VTADRPKARDVLVRASGVARTFGRGPAAVVAVHGASCEIHAGARLALTGPSGSGKSTLLHLLAGLDEPTAGTITWPALGDRHQLRPGPVGVVFQGPSLLPPLDAAENVALPLLLAGHSEAEATAAALRALDRLGIEDLAGALPDELSGGQAQRVAVARVLAGRPRLILADEPTGQLDHGHGAVVVDALLEAAAATGAALLVATHDPRVAGRFPQRWSMTDGRLDCTAGDAGDVPCSA